MYAGMGRDLCAGFGELLGYTPCDGFVGRSVVWMAGELMSVSFFCSLLLTRSIVHLTSCSMNATYISLWI